MSKEETGNVGCKMKTEDVKKLKHLALDREVNFPDYVRMVLESYLFKVKIKITGDDMEGQQQI